MSDLTLYTTTAPVHEYRLFVAPRPLPGRPVGRVVGEVYDVAPEFEQRTRELDGQSITVVTVTEFENLVEVTMEADEGRRYTRRDYEEAGVWDPEEIGRSLGIALVTIRPLRADTGRDR
jgi:hypothetical protein